MAEINVSVTAERTFKLAPFACPCCGEYLLIDATRRLPDGSSVVTIVHPVDPVTLTARQSAAHGMTVDELEYRLQIAYDANRELRARLGRSWWQRLRVVAYGPRRWR